MSPDQVMKKIGDARRRILDAESIINQTLEDYLPGYNCHVHHVSDHQCDEGSPVGYCVYERSYDVDRDERGDPDPEAPCFYCERWYDRWLWREHQHATKIRLHDLSHVPLFTGTSP